MIPSVADDIQVESTVRGNKIAMSFDENSLTHLMSVLTDLYSDPELAVLREYSTNARDSHIEAGETRPIEITLPSAMSPFLTIKDFGVGLNQQDIEDIYSKYGASTKRETNEQTGVLGLGCKSALTYTAQFSLVGIKDGARTMVSIARDEDGAGSMTIVESGTTDEPNGVEVIIPVRRYNTLETKAQDLFRFWEPGTVLVNGKEPARIEGTSINDKILMVQGVPSDYIVMGGVPYPVEIPTPLSSNYSVVLFADIGEVNFTPSREALQYTKRTKERIQSAKEEFLSGVEKAAQEDISTAQSPREAFARCMSWRQALPRLKLDMTYQQQEIPIEFSAPEGQNFVVSARNSSKLSQHGKYPNLAAYTFINGLVVHGYSMANFTASHKKKLMMFADSKSLTVEHFILIEDKMDTTWIDPKYVVDWESIRAIKLPIGGRNGGASRMAGSFEVWEEGTYRAEAPADEIDDSAPIFYFTTHDFKIDGRRAYRNSDVVRLATKYFPDCTIVCMGNNRVAKFLRDFPDAERVHDVLSKVYTKLADDISEDTLLAYNLDREESYRRPLKMLDEAQIDDPELVRAIILLRLDGVEEAIRPLRDFDPLLGMLKISDRLRSVGSEECDPLRAYPLVEDASWRHEGTPHQHIYLYINAVYAAKESEKEQVS